MQPHKRSGSPWTGLWTVAGKEMTDHFSSMRTRLLEILIVLAAAAAVYAAIQNLRQTVSEDPFLLLRVFTTSHEPLISFMAFLGFLVPLIAIALGFDAINSENTNRTMSRILSQPIYRDALLVGKFLAALATIAIMLLALWLLIIGLGLLFLGVPPSGEEVVRAFAFLLATLAYAGVWLALAMLFSTVFRQPATAALAALAVWLFFAVFWSMLSGMAAQVLTAGIDNPNLAALDQLRINLALSRLSPNTLYGEIALALLNPATKAFGPVVFSQLQGALLGMPLPVGQSILLVWPHITGLVSSVILLFTLNYVLFQRQEVRA